MYVCVCVSYLELCCPGRKPENLQQTSPWTEEPPGSDPVLQDLHTQKFAVGTTLVNLFTSDYNNTLTCADGIWVFIQVCGQSQTEEHREPENEKISGRVEIHQLQVGQTNSCDHT